MNAVAILAPTVGIAAACHVLDVPRASYYRQHPILGPVPQPLFQPLLIAPTVPARALRPDERQTVRDLLHAPRFQDVSPAAIQADGATRERRDQCVHPPYQKPELLATAPNQLWSWDITKLRGPVKWTYFYLYVILDVFSRYVVGWMVAPRESAELAARLIASTCKKQKIQPGQLIVHADRGAAMRSKQLAFLLADLGVTKTHSRPYTSNDNPYSESQFKTMKYRSEFPNRFGCIQDSRNHCHTFFPWYNGVQRHSGIGMMTPEMVHYGTAKKIRDLRQSVLDQAYVAHPERFVHNAPKALELPTQVWINKPKTSNEETH